MNKLKRYNPDIDILDYEFTYNINEKIELNEIFNNNPTIEINDLRRISLWKLNRVLEIPDNILKKLQYLADLDEIDISDSFVKEILDDLVESKGVGYPMASTILKFIKPNVFPIIDVRAYRALTGVKPDKHTYSYDGYIKYAKQLKVLSDSINKPFYEMDEQLYCFDKHHNKKI